MISRIEYNLRRIREAGPRATLAKIYQKLRIYGYWPVYATGLKAKTVAGERHVLRAFGRYCSDAFREMKTSGEPGYSERFAERLVRAEAPDWQVLGYGPMAKPAGNGWHRDPLHDYDFTQNYFAFVDFLATNSRCDVKIPWEISRLQWLLWDAEAIVNGGQEIARSRAHAALTTIEDWACANPAGYGVNWTCGMEVAIRGAVLSVICGILSQDLDDARTDKLTGVLRDHQLFLARFPEVSDVPGNHYLTDLMGEVVLHAALDGLESTYTARSLDKFANAAQAQFEEDGCHLERATIYHRLAVDIVALPYAIALRVGHSSASTLTGIMQRACAFMVEIASETGRLPVFGDQDSGFVFWFAESAQLVDKRLGASPNAPRTDLYSFISSLADSEAFFCSVTQRSGVRSGFASLSEGSASVVVKTGPQGLKGRAPHDHDDTLSLTFTLGAHDLIIDPGCHSYTLDPDIRVSQIISSRHNAPVPYSRERFTPTRGSINATVRGAATGQLSSHKDGKLTATLPASVSSGGINITRSVKLESNRLQISDIWQIDDADSVRLLWLIHPDWTIIGQKNCERMNAPLELTLSCSKHIVKVQLVCEGAKFSIRKDRYSPDYGCWRECQSLYLESMPDVAGSAEFILTWEVE